MTQELKFIRPYLTPPTAVPRHVVTHTLSHRRDFLDLLVNHVTAVVAAKRESHALLSFFAAVIVESMAQMCDSARTPTRSGITEEEVLQRALPLLHSTFKAKKSPEFQIGGYMLATVVVSKVPMKDEVLLALMGDIAKGFNDDTVAPALASLALISQTRSLENATMLPQDVVSSILNIEGLQGRLEEMAAKYRIDHLVIGLAHGIMRNLQTYGHEELQLVFSLLQNDNLGRRVQKNLLGGVVDLANGFESLNQKAEEAELVRDQLATLFLEWTEQSDKTTLGRILPVVLKEKAIDVDMLELTLRTVITRQIAAEASEATAANKEVALAKKEKATVDSTLALIKKPKVSLLAPESDVVFEQYQQVSNMAAKQPSGLKQLLDHESVSAKTPTEPIVLSLLAALWTANSTPIITRAAALKQASEIITATIGSKIDFQALIPLALVALADPAERVRREADALIRALRSVYPSTEAASKKKKSKGDTMEYWGSDSIYGPGEATENLQWLDSTDAKKFLDAIINHGLQECIMDATFVGRLMENDLGHSKDKREDGRLKSSVKTSVMAFLASHVICVPRLLIKLRLLTMLNGVDRARTENMLPALKNWAAGSIEDHKKQCAHEHVDIKALEQQLVSVVAEGEDADSVAVLIDIIRTGSGGPVLVEAATKRVIAIWESLEDSVQISMAISLLEIRLSDEDGSAEAAEVLNNTKLPTDAFKSLLETARQHLKPAVGAPTAGVPKRRKTAFGEDEQEDAVAVSVTRATVVLELLESQGAANHAELLGMLFNILGDIGMAQFSGITFMQNLLLSCIRDIVKHFKTTGMEFTLSQHVRADVLVTCIRSTSSPQVQNLALLLLSDLADLAPDTIKHSVMPIFTFMGANTLRQDDEYSAHVIEQTVQRVIPPLVKSLYEGNGNPLAGVTELISTFVTSYRHVPAHRRVRLFSALTETLSPMEFAFAVLAKVAARYNVQDQDDEVKEFSAQLAGEFTAQVQVSSASKCLDVVFDVLEPKEDGVSKILFSDEEELTGVSNVEVAQRLLGSLKAFLASAQLKSKVLQIFKSNETEVVATIHKLFSDALERAISLGEKYANDAAISPYASAIMDNLLDLLSIPEFVKVIETLIARDGSPFRSSALSTLRDRILAEYRTDSASRAAIIGLSSKIADIVNSAGASNEIKADAILCLQAVTTKFGKSDVNSIAALADVIVGPGALGNPDAGLRVLSLVTLTLMAGVLGGRIVPVLPKSVPHTITYLQTATTTPSEENRLLHNAAFRYIQELVNTVPSFMATYLPKFIPLLAESAKHEEFEDLTSSEVREDLLDAIAEKLDFKTIVASFTKQWSVICAAGEEAIEEAVETVQKAIENNSKGTVQKASQSLLQFFSVALDIRRVDLPDLDAAEIEELESIVLKTVLDMVYKLNDSIFKPMFLRFVEWAVEDLKGSDEEGCLKRTVTLWKLLQTLAENLKALVTDYFAYPLANAITLLTAPFTASSVLHLSARSAILKALTASFTSDERDFWLSPTHFDPLLPALLAQLDIVPKLTVDFARDLAIPALVEFAAAAQSEEHSKKINQGLLKRMRSEEMEVRLAGVIALKEVWRRNGDNWMGLLPETVPILAEVLEDDEEEVEREGQRLIAVVEEFVGEGEVQGMLT